MLIGGLKSGSTDQQPPCISELLALLLPAAFRRSLLSAFLMLAASVWVVAQAGTSVPRPVSRNVEALDYADRAVPGVKAEVTPLSEQTPQTTPYLSDVEPLSMVVVLDASSSMAARIGEARKALRELIRTSNAQEMALVVIHDEPQVVVRLGGSGGDIERVAETVHGDGFGAMWDGMYLGIRELQNSCYGRKAMVVLSDDSDRYSRHTPSEVTSLLKRADVPVYAIGMFDRYADRFQARMRALQLDEITSVTRGRMLPINDFSAAAAQIAYELRHPIRRHAPNGQ